MSIATDFEENLRANNMGSAGSPGTAIPGWTPYIGLMTVAMNEAGTGGTEASYAGYARVSPTFGAPAQVGGVATRAASANADFAAPASSQTFVQLVYFDALTGGNPRKLVPLDPPVVVPAGQVPRLVAGQVTVGEA